MDFGAFCHFDITECGFSLFDFTFRQTHKVKLSRRSKQKRKRKWQKSLKQWGQLSTFHFFRIYLLDDGGILETIDSQNRLVCACCLLPSRAFIFCYSLEITLLSLLLLRLMVLAVLTSFKVRLVGNNVQLVSELGTIQVSGNEYKNSALWLDYLLVVAINCGKYFFQKAHCRRRGPRPI